METTETVIATGTDLHKVRWTVKRLDGDGFTEYYLHFGGERIHLNDLLIGALEQLPELD